MQWKLKPKFNKFNWHRWFAWYPIVIGDKAHWLESVQRRTRHDPWDGLYVYKEIDFGS